MNTVLAFDLGATSARGIVYTFNRGRLEEKEIYRFTDYQIFHQEKKEIYWNFPKLLKEIKNIISITAKNYQIDSIGFDSWGCDFGLISKEGELVMLPLCYQTMLFEENLHYGNDLPPCFQEKTGIANASINTSSQLLFLKEHYPYALLNADKLLMIPDLIQYFLTGQVLAESSIASTSQLFDMQQQQWSLELIKKLALPPTLFSTIVLPFTKVGYFQTENYSIPIHSVIQHDTASAVYALPTNEDTNYFLSSGTWSVIGQKTERGLILETPLDNQYSYEQAGDGKVLKIQNLLGMWFIEEALQEVNTKQSLTIQEVQTMLAENQPLRFFFNNQDPRFSNKGKFVSTLKKYGEENQFSLLKTASQLFLTIYQNLAFKYTQVFTNLMDKPCKTIFIFGGGSKSNFLNQMIADLTQCQVAVCAPESSALGNALAQLSALNFLRTRDNLVTVIQQNHPPLYFAPKKNEPYSTLYQEYLQFTQQ